jgi:TonB family protein
MFKQPSLVTGRSTKSQLISLAIHAISVTGMFALHYTVQSRREPARSNLQITLLTPAITRAPKRIAVRGRSKALEIQKAAKLPAPKLAILAPPLVEPPVIKAEAVTPIMTEALPKAPSPPQPKAAVQTEIFTNAPPAAKSAASIPARVQIGGFEGAATRVVQTDRRRQSVVAGFGDAGTVPAPGAHRGIATGTGFGDASVSTGSGASQRSIRAGGFGDAAPSPPSTGGARHITPARPVSPAQILEKPRPAYTEEARRLQIEGEVQLEVQFRASGEVYILRIVQGLGHGLDENAAQAARTIRFLPAKRDGLPVDSTATVHIIFQLAS